MKTFEIIMFIIGLILLITIFINGKKFKIISFELTSSLIILSVVNTIQNGFKWMYYPIYLFSIIVLVLLLFTNSRKIIIGIILSILLIVSVLGVLLFPVNEIPKPNGKYLIGTKVYDVEDYKRIESYDNSGENRKFKIQTWYPTDSISGLKKANWFYDGVTVAKGLSKDSNLPSFTLNHLAKIKSNSYIDAKISDKENSYPVVIISHGWRSLRNLHQDLAEELASQGYIVIGIEHTYGSDVTIFNDGTIKYINSDALLDNGSRKEFLNRANKLVNTYADDVSKTIDFMHELNMKSDFSGKIDEDRIGLLGHSTGGGADVRVALDDNRIKALIGLDAWVEPINQENINKGLNIPSLFLRSEQWKIGPNNKNLGILAEKSKQKPIVYQINGTNHIDFSMIYMISPAMKEFGLSGKLEGKKLTKILVETMDSFFNQTLKDNKKPVVEMKNYNEVEKVKLP